MFHFCSRHCVCPSWSACLCAVQILFGAALQELISNLGAVARHVRADVHTCCIFLGIKPGTVQSSYPITLQN